MQEMGSREGFWSLLTRDEQRALLALGLDKKYPPGAALCRQGDPATHEFVVLNGWVKILSVTDDGHENVLALLGDGDVIGETAGEITGHRNATIQAINTVHALIVSYQRFSSFLDTHPAADQVYRRMMTQRWSDTDTMLRRRAFTSGAQRLAEILIDLAGRHGGGAYGAVDLALPLSQEELANLTGASRATVTRALSSWRKRGLIRTGQRRITITDLRALRQIAGPPSAGQPVIEHRRGRLPTLSRRTPDAVTQIPSSPYKGLRAFEKADYDLFFGREAVVRELVYAVNTQPLVPVVGPSGVGKSSVVHAGLLPRLEEQGAGWGFITVRPRPTLLTALASGLARLSGSSVPLPVAELEEWKERLSQADLVGAAELACAGSGKERVLVTVDQFEEVLSQDCDLLLQQLADLPNDGMLTAVLTLREDSFGRFFVRHKSFGERLRRSAVALRGMNRDELAEAIRTPAARRGVQIAGPLVDELAGAVCDRPGALPLLEFSLDQMWRTMRSGQHTLSFDAYEEIGRLDGALAAHADKILDGLSQAERVIIRKLFVNHLTSLIRPDARQVLRRSDCGPGDWQIIIRLANERLLTISRDDDGNETAEVVHEALLQAWGQLRGWLDAEGPFRSWRQLLRYAMTQWTDTGVSGTLLTGALLATSEQWLEERAADLNLDERRFIEMSLTRREAEQRHWELLYRREVARKLSRDAETTQDPVLALLLALEVLERSPDVQADQLVRTRLSRLGVAEIDRAGGETDPADLARLRRRLTLADWSRGPGPDGRWLLGDSAAGLIIDRRGHARYGAGLVIPMPGPVVAAACTPTGVVCLATEIGQLAVWQLADHAEKVCGRDLGIPITCIAVSEAARTVAAACDDGIIRVLRGEDLSDIDDIPVPGFIRDIDVSTDRLVAALSYARQIRVWDLVSRTRVCESVVGIGASRLAIDSGEDYVIVDDVVSDGGIGRFPLSAAALTAWARRAAGRELTAAERRHFIDDPSIDRSSVVA